MPAALLSFCLLSSQAFASSGIYLDGSVEFSGRCADLTVEGTAFDGFSMPMKSMGFSVSLNEKTVFDALWVKIVVTSIESETRGR